MNKRILIFAHNTIGLGHYMRCAAIAKEINKIMPDASVLLLTGLHYGEHVNVPPGLEIMRLPAYETVIKDDKWVMEPHKLKMNKEEFIELRKGIILNLVQNYKPDIFLVDKTAVGSYKELLPSIEYLKTQLPNSKLILGLRGALDEPEKTIEKFKKNDVYNILEKYYDYILAYCEKEVFDLTKLLNFSEKINKKLIYVGFVINKKDDELKNKSEIRAATKSKNKKLIVVSAGGGIDGFKILETALKSTKKLKLPNIKLLVFTGPFIPEKKFKILKRFENQSITVEKHTPLLIDLINAANLVIAMGGNNTISEILSTNTPAIIIPRVFPEREQLFVSQRLSELGYIFFIHPNSLNDKILAKTIKEIFEGKINFKKRNLRTDGAIRTAKFINNLLK